MKYFDIYVAVIFVFKIIFIVLSLTNIYLKIKGKKNTVLESNIKYWKEKTEFIFTILMAFLLIFLFSPRTNRTMMINSETKLLLYLFGFVLLITSKWSEFIKESKLFSYLQKSV
jgi:hypothetical protein